MAKPTVKVELESGTTIRITFPPGTKGNLRSTIPLDELMKVLQAPDADVEGQEVGSDSTTCIPGQPD